MYNEIFNLTTAIVRLNNEILDAVNNDQPQTALYLEQKVKALRVEIEVIKNFHPLFQ